MRNSRVRDNSVLRAPELTGQTVRQAMSPHGKRLQSS